MKKIFYGKCLFRVSMIAFAGALILSGCGMLPMKNTANENKTDNSVAKVSLPAESSEEEQKSLIQTAVEGTLSEGEAVRKLCFSDYDRDGRPEAFVMTGKIILEQAQEKMEAWYASEEEVSEEEFDTLMKQKDYDEMLTLWFAYVQDGEAVCEKIQEKVTYQSDILHLKSADLFQCVSSCATSYPADLYQVQGNQCKVIFHGDTMDNHGQNVALANASAEHDDFQSVASVYDSGYDSFTEMKMGHTWKPYYFHYNNGAVTEYIGREISLPEFQQEYPNAGQMLQEYQKKKEILSVIKRDNGIVHVNFVKREKDGYEQYTYVTFKVSDGKLTEPVADDGTYHTTIEEEGEYYSHSKMFVN